MRTMSSLILFWGSSFQLGEILKILVPLWCCPLATGLILVFFFPFLFVFRFLDISAFFFLIKKLFYRWLLNISKPKQEMTWAIPRHFMIVINITLYLAQTLPLAGLAHSVNSATVNSTKSSRLAGLTHFPLSSWGKNPKQMLKVVNRIHDVVVDSIRAVFKEMQRQIFSYSNSSERDLIIVFFGWSCQLDYPSSLLKAAEIG